MTKFKCRACGAVVETENGLGTAGMDVPKSTPRGRCFPVERACV